MIKIKLLFFSCLIFLISCHRTRSDCRLIINNMQEELESGNLREVVHLADYVRKSCSCNSCLSDTADSLVQIAARIGLDFSVSEEQVLNKIEKSIGSFSPDEKVACEKKGWLEGRLIDGKKMYFNRAVSNLVLLKKFHEEKEVWLKEISEDPEMIFRLKHTEKVVKSSYNNSDPAEPVNLGIIYTITVHPDAVPEGETIRCWMPWPKSNHPRQQKVELLNTSCPEYMISPDSAVHSTIYMKEQARKGVATVFHVSFRYQSNAQYFNIKRAKILPYDKSSDNYKKYTSQQVPQITFTGNIKRLADSLTAPDDDPAAIVRKIYLWFKANIPWTGALEYSIMPDIPGYVCRNRRGDCGMQTFLFISMLRYKGIPVRWQSGWMVPPGAENLHDWCEVYYEGPGWIPVDVSYDLQNSETPEVREYYLSGIDSYRLILNDGVAGNLYPGKQFLRSEPYDFQRGEVEWKGGNLYFDKWSYDMKIEYLQ